MFPSDFILGAASSAYQIEGRSGDDGAGACIWDDFCAQGHIRDGSDARTACDHMHRYKEDIALMAYMGIRHYRFSISWARLMPEGTGRINEKAAAMYRDMLLEMKKRGITPYITLFHWEYPKSLQARGGWMNEHSPEWFAEYAAAAADQFSDLCEYFITFNEPQCFIGLANLNGVHAPGYRLPVQYTFLMTHNMLKAHGMAVKALRSHAKQPIQVGYAPTCGVAMPYTQSPEDIEAAKKVYFGFYNDTDNWTWNVSWFSDPVFLGQYPKEGMEKYAQYLGALSEESLEKDLELISQPLDFMGQNIYNGYYVRAGADGEPEFVGRTIGYTKTAVDWPVTPECLYWGPKFLYERYHLPIFITENGMSCHDCVSPDGRVHDPNRIDFMDAYLGQVQRALEEGVGLKGYFAWTFLDNFEWEKGYQERFGMVYVDFVTQRRIIKDSAYWYQKVIQTNGASLTCNNRQRPILFLEPDGSSIGTESGCTAAGSQTGECRSCVQPDGSSRISEGVFAGYSLSRLWEEHRYLFGDPATDRFASFIKIIDALNDLSVQAHAEDAYAKDMHAEDAYIKDMHAEVHENGSENIWYEVVSCPDYKVFKLNLNGAYQMQQEYPFLNMSVVAGCGVVNGQMVKKGDHFILPACYGTVEMMGEMEVAASTFHKNSN